MRLTEQEKSHIRGLTAQVEARTGIQVLSVVTGKSDTYPEVPWKAFSLGAVLAILALGMATFLGFGWGRSSPLFWGIPALGAGMTLALAGIFLKPVARLFLSRERSSQETRQFAQSLFLERGLGRTQSRRAVLILVSLFERRASIVADTGILDRVPSAELDSIAAAMDAALSRTSAINALAGGLSNLEKLLLQRGFVPAAAGDEIAEELLDTEGPKP